MDADLVSMKRWLHRAAAATIGISGILHLYLGLSLLGSKFYQFGEFFLIVSIAQIFWVFPMLKGYGRAWLFTGIGGNLALFGLWVLTRFPNPISSVGLPVNTIGIAEESCQLAFVAIAIALAYSLRRGASSQKRENSPDTA